MLLAVVFTHVWGGQLIVLGSFARVAGTRIVGERWSAASGNEARVNIELAAAEAKRKQDEP